MRVSRKLLLCGVLLVGCTKTTRSPDGAVGVTLVLSDGSTPLHDYRGVIAGPSPNSPKACGYATSTTLAMQLYQVGIRSIRNNDYYDDTLDFDLMFNCSGTAYGSNAACGKEYPCWKGCTVTYPSCSSMTYNVGPVGGMTSDGRFDSIVSGGFEPFLRLGGEYNVTAGNLASGVTARTARGPQTDEEEANWIEAAKCAASHYASKQAFPYLNIITETTGNFWSRDWASFHLFWHRAFAALKKTFGAQFKIGGPGMWGLEWIINTVEAHEDAQSCVPATDLPARDFLKTLADNGDVPDWLGIHIFSSDASDYPRVIAAFKALLSKSGPCFGAGKPLESPWKSDYFSQTELVVDAFMPGKFKLFDGSALPDPDAFFSGAAGGALNTSNFIVFQNEGISRAYQYRAGEQGASGPVEGITNCDASATPKPRANVYRFWNRMMEAGALQGTILAPVQDSKLYVLHASTAVGRRFVLLANTGDTAVAYTPTWQTGAKSLTAHATRSLYTVDGTSDGTKATSVVGDTVTIEAGTAQLLDLQ